MAEEKIHEEYFRLTREYQSKYGKKTALLMQVGAFFEVYGKRTPDNQIHYSEIVDICNVCGGLAIADKKVAFEGGQIVMAGVRDYNIDKYLPKLVDSGYTAIVYVQEKVGKNITRKMHSIYSAGTYLPTDIDTAPQITNNIMCIWHKLYKSFSSSSRENIVCGISVANIFTGQSFLFEYESPFSLEPTTFDELERCISVYQPSEIISIGPFDIATQKKILGYTGCQTSMIHYHNIDEIEDKTRNPIMNATLPKYIKHSIEKQYSRESDVFELYSEFQQYELATQSFVYLLHFIQEHNPNLVKNIQKPVFQNVSNRVILANHTLRQLNIIPDGNATGVYSSVATFLNKCSTPLGKRRFYSQITNPVFDAEWLNAEYNMIATMLEPSMFPMVDILRKILRDICDIEKIGRLIVTRKISPDSFYRFYTSILKIQQLHICLFESRELTDYLSDTPNYKTDAHKMDAHKMDAHKMDAHKMDAHKYLEEKIVRLIDTISKTLMVEECAGLTSMSDRNIIREGVSSSLDDNVRELKKGLDLFNQIKDGLNKLMSKTSNTDTEFVKLHETDKMGMSLQITKTRSVALKQILKGLTGPILFGGNIVQPGDIKFKTASTTNEEIDIAILTKTIHSINQLRESIAKQVATIYQDFVAQYENTCIDDLNYIIDYVARLDIILLKTWVANEYNYCRPVLVLNEPDSQSFVNTTGLRHALIEHIQQNETYVANDLSLAGDDSSFVGHDKSFVGHDKSFVGHDKSFVGGDTSSPNGILLYGTNAVGKTSLIRALGICIIMAQTGMYVPCSTMKYRPYRSIFTRILGNDNMFKNLSTFAVEMSELRVILNYADNRSLVLGDELCSGTETESALSIFTAGLCHLNATGASFIFATHFHEIVRFDEIKGLRNIALKHMSVYYDRETDSLVYDRLLKDGPGNKMYGLEVAKSMHLPLDFIDKAYQIRSKYFPDTKGELAMGSASKYNSKKIKSMCEKCNQNIAIETHHLLEQNKADANGYIGAIHKNHSGNLMALCEKCHQAMHREPSPMKKTKTTKGYKIK